MNQHLGALALLVAACDEAITWYTQALGFALIGDANLGGDTRWALLAPPGLHEARLRWPRPRATNRVCALGNRTGSRVFLLLNTDDFQRDWQRMHGALPARTFARSHATRPTASWRCSRISTATAGICCSRLDSGFASAGATTSLANSISPAFLAAPARPARAMPGPGR